MLFTLMFTHLGERFHSIALYSLPDSNTCTALNPAQCLEAPRLMLLACSHHKPFTTLRTPAAPALQPRRPSVRTAPAFPLRLLLQPQVQHYMFQSRSEVMLAQRRDHRLPACRLAGSRHRCFVCSRCVQGLYLARSCPAPAASLPLPRETCTGENMRARQCVCARVSDVVAVQPQFSPNTGSRNGTCPSLCGSRRAVR